MEFFDLLVVFLFGVEFVGKMSGVCYSFFSVFISGFYFVVYFIKIGLNKKYCCIKRVKLYVFMYWILFNRKNKGVDSIFV